MINDGKTKVMFVAGDAGFTRWLQGVLLSQTDCWEMTFVDSAEHALNRMVQSPSHVVVSDMRLAAMSGAELLARVKQQYPQTIRIILADFKDRESIVECVGTAHQFLSKPCHPDELRSAIDRACAFNQCMKSDRIRAIIGEMECLPSVPSLLSEVIQELQRDDADIDKVGVIIGKDIAMTAKLLKIVNSAFFGLDREISSPAEAVSYLGVETIKALVLAANAFATFEKHNTGPISLERLWNHSLGVAGMARQIAGDLGADRGLMEESFIAGMLHDIGKLALAANLPAQYQSVFDAAENLGLSLHAAEEAAFGAHHGDIGGYLLKLWGLPAGVVNAITFHHEPAREDSAGFTPVAAVHLANGLTHEAANPRTEFLDNQLVESLGIEARLPAWRELARN